MRQAWTVLPRSHVTQAEPSYPNPPLEIVTGPGVCTVSVGNCSGMVQVKFFFLPTL